MKLKVLITLLFANEWIVCTSDGVFIKSAEKCGIGLLKSLYSRIGNVIKSMKK